ncbi:hypothetical protein Tco_0899906, partial [Tanacetum coccineum]
MSLPDHNIKNSTIRSILEKEKLTGPNFTNWYRNLRIVLRAEKKLVHLEKPLPPIPLPALYDAQLEVACLMLASMTSELQKNLESYNAY